VEVTVRGENGKAVYGPDGKVLKTKIRMEDATFADGTAQSLYFEPGHPKAGLFKGMEVILQERGLIMESKLKAQCNSKFQCPNKGQTNCCCRQVLYNQPDFVHVESLLETYCKSRGVEVIFLPKFHCELNFIEQCWGYAKRIYRHYPPSSKESDLEQNVLSALEAVPLDSMRKSVQLPFTIIIYWSDYCTGSPYTLVGSWMHMRRGWMGNRLCGLQRSIGDIGCFQSEFWRSITRQITIR
jgi:hypothetical protein